MQGLEGEGSPVFAPPPDLQIHGRHVATNRLVTGAYASEYGNTDVIEKAMKKVQVGFST